MCAALRLLVCLGVFDVGVIGEFGEALADRHARGVRGGEGDPALERLAYLRVRRLDALSELRVRLGLDGLPGRRDVHEHQLKPRLELFL